MIDDRAAMYELSCPVVSHATVCFPTLLPPGIGKPREGISTKRGYKCLKSKAGRDSTA